MVGVSVLHNALELWGAKNTEGDKLLGNVNSIHWKPWLCPWAVCPVG